MGVLVWFDNACWLSGWPVSSIKSQIKLYPLFEREGMYRVPLLISSLNHIGVVHRSDWFFGRMLPIKEIKKMGSLSV